MSCKCCPQVTYINYRLVTWRFQFSKCAFTPAESEMQGAFFRGRRRTRRRAVWLRLLLLRNRGVLRWGKPPRTRRVRSQIGCVWKYVRTLRYNLHQSEFDNGRVASRSESEGSAGSGFYISDVTSARIDQTSLRDNYPAP